MSRKPFDNLPLISKEESFKILQTKPENLNLESDYYKAIFHLEKFPCKQTEDILLETIKSKSKENSIKLAKRKAVEILARIRCYRAIPMIADCLKSSDPFLVENSAWALQELGCKDPLIIKFISSLLLDSKQNRRVLVQSLAAMNAISELDNIQQLLNKSNSKLIRGACISAISRLTGSNRNLNELRENLLSINQNQRHCAVHDITQSRQVDLFPSILSAPIAPSFKLKALSEFWPTLEEVSNNLCLHNQIRSILIDNPNDLQILHNYPIHPTNEFLIDEMFSTDFSKCYLALKTIKRQKPFEIWPLLKQSLSRFKKDYGALYFLTLLLKNSSEWPKGSIDDIEAVLLFCLSDIWPAFMKFRPTAILALINLKPLNYIDKLDVWLDEESTPFWASRYASLIALQRLLNEKTINIDRVNLNFSCNDTNRFVSSKARMIMSNYSI